MTDPINERAFIAACLALPCQPGSVRAQQARAFAESGFDPQNRELPRDKMVVFESAYRGADLVESGLVDPYMGN